MTAIPLLIRILGQDDDELAREAADALAAIGLAAAPSVEALLRSPDPDRRARALLLLGRLRNAAL